MGPFIDVLQNYGIVAQYIMPGGPEQNGVSRREQIPYGYGGKYDEYL